MSCKYPEGSRSYKFCNFCDTKEICPEAILPVAEVPKINKQAEIVSSGFSKVPFEQFQKDMSDEYKYFENHAHEDELLAIYDSIQLPSRSSKNSAGFDFKAPFGFTLHPGNTIKIPTGIRVQMDDNTFLLGLPKSGLGSKYQVSLANTAAVVDADYYGSDNYGHILITLTIPETELPNQISEVFGKPLATTIDPMEIKAGNKFIQAIFLQYGVTADDHKVEKAIRNGGHGSTGA